MSDFEVPSEDAPALGATARLYPMKIGDATVYIAQVGPEPEVESGGEFYAVKAPSPEEAFQKASEAIRELVRIVGDRITQLGDDTKPSEVSVEFSIGFEAKGKASFIPVLFQAEATASSALKITSVWKLKDS